MMTREQKERLSERRLLWPYPQSKAANAFQFSAHPVLRKKLKEWISEHTTGEFYIGQTVLYFVDDKDAMAYTLYDVKRKIEAEQAG